MAYTTSTLVTNWLGANYTSSDLSSGDVTTHISRADSVIKARLSTRCYPFNAIDSTKTDGTTTYVTPGAIELISRHLAVSYCFQQLRVMANNSVLADSVAIHEAAGLALLEEVALQGLEPAVYLNETITFGLSDSKNESWSLLDNEAFLASTSPLDSGDPPHVILSSVRIGSGTTTTYSGATAAELLDYRNGVNFSVRWDSGYERYVFTDISGFLYQGSGTTKITWEWSYDRDRGEVGTSGANMSGVFHGA